MTPGREAAEATGVAILPSAAASRVVTTAVSRSAWAVAVAIVALTPPVVLDVFAARGITDSLPVPLAALGVMLGLLALSGLRPSTATRIVAVVGGGACALAYTYSLLAADPTLNGDGGFLLNRLAMVLVLGGVTVTRPAVGLLWSGLGYAVATGTGLAASALAGVAFAPGWGPTIALVVYAGAFSALAAVRARQSRNAPDLARLEAQTRRLDIESQFEQRAAAVVHDTVLSDLTAVMNSTGSIGDRARERFRADVATLRDAAWLRESAGPAVAAPGDAAVRNAIEALVSDFQWRGLTVDVTGDSETAIRLSPAAGEALVSAARACLENVVVHAQTPSAELVVSTTDDTVSVMVIDHGRGFVPDRVAHDRLGLRASVVTRVALHGGAVRVWSTPGAGTSVLISIPAEPAPVEPAPVEPVAVGDGPAAGEARR